MASQIQTLNLPLRIHRRGDFFSDDGFLDFRGHFEAAANDLLREFDLLRHEDSFKSYRHLRDRHMSATDRTAKIAEESDKYKIVMDVEGFSDSNLQVRVSGPNEIVVEGRQEISDGGVYSQRSLSRRFSLPGLALVQDSTSVLSSDNVLTINIPKKIQEITDDVSRDTSLSLNQSDAAKEVTCNTVQESIQNAKKTFSSLLSDNVKNDNIWDLQIVPRNSFFDDSFFETVRQNFQKSIDEKMTNRLRRIDSIEDGGLFRKVRETKEEDVQAISVIEDAREHKIVLDVHGFSEGDLKVRAINERELMVEGNVEKSTEYTSCTHTFRRSFTLPSSVDIKQATSALSSEGILTIIVPKKLQSIDHLIPVRSEVNSHILKTEQERRENLHREYVVPVTEEDLNVQTTQERSLSKSTVADIASSYNVANSQNLLNKLEKTIQLCEEIDNRPAPHVPLCLSDKKVNKSQIQESHICSESSDLIRESQRLVDESARLLQDVSSSEKAIHKEHFVPVEVDAGIAFSTKPTNPTQQSTSQNISSTSTTTTTSRVIPISFKGSFYNDSVFEDARKSIDKEVKDVFMRFKQSSVVASEEDKSSDAEVVKEAKRRQESELVKSTQTVSTILDDAHSYKIVVDVYGFEERELSVKVSGQNEISIEGHSEKCKAGSISKHSFQRSFQLPEYVDLERTSTALSEEGILTISIPKKNQLLPLNKRSLPFSERIEKDIREREMKPTLVVDSSGIVQDKRSEITSTKSSGFNGKREFIVPVSVEEASTTASAVGNVQSASDLSSQISTSSQTSADVSQGILSSSTSCSSIDTQIEKNTTTNRSQSQSLNVDTSSSREETKEIVTRPLFNLPIVSRGYFFDDNIFQDSRPMFETILRNKMNRFNRSTSFVDDLSFFKCLRDIRLTGGNQVATLSEDDQFNKIVLDVHGFTEDNLKVRALSDNEILIEGSTEEKTGCSVSRKSFRKNFVLPDNVDLRGATSVLSSDGVLNIKIPKRKL